MKNKDKYPFYPELTEEGEKEAQNIMDGFKEKMSKIAAGVMGELYCDVASYIETDSWMNFRNEIMEGFKDYGNNKIHAEYDFKAIRQKIFEDNKKEIIKDLNQDLIAEVESLKHTIKIMDDLRNMH